jgi:hypothetical protein
MYLKINNEIVLDFATVVKKFRAAIKLSVFFLGTMPDQRWRRLRFCGVCSLTLGLTVLLPDYSSPSLLD